jgi:DNA-directed RNA polymerase specialized sigma24 family protein
VPTPRDRQSTTGTDGRSVCCSFCRKEPEIVGELIEGSAGPDRAPAYICADCVELCAHILEHQSTVGSTDQEPDHDEIAAAHRKLVKEKVDQALSALTSLERAVIELRYGLSNGYTYTIDDVAVHLGITPERVHEIESNAVKLLRSHGAQT